MTLDSPPEHPVRTLIGTDELSGKERYQLLTSLIVPRPIGWLSTFSRDGKANLAPFSYFAAISPTPMLLAVSIGHRQGEPKDSLRNIRDSRGFCVNVVTESQLEVMNATSGEFAPDVDEFRQAGLTMGHASEVEAPYVADCPAVMECRLYKEVDLGDVPTSLVLGEVVAVRLDPSLERIPGTFSVDTTSLRPVGRLSGKEYGLIRAIRALQRPGK